jgi:hypothetical protein
MDAEVFFISAIRISWVQLEAPRWYCPGAVPQNTINLVVAAFGQGLRVNDSCGLLVHFERHIMRVWRGISFAGKVGMLTMELSGGQTPNSSYRVALEMSLR